MRQDNEQVIFNLRFQEKKSLLARDSNPRPSDPGKLTSLHYRPVCHLLSRTFGPNLVATSLRGSVS